jgi:hypothetical protein
MDKSLIFISLSELFQEIAEAFAIDPKEIFLINLFVLFFIALLIIPAFVHSFILSLKQKKHAEKIYKSKITELKLNTEELQILEKLAHLIPGGAKVKHHLVLKASVFNGAVKKLLNEEEPRSALISSLRLKLGFVLWDNEGPVHSTAELPKGTRLYIFPQYGMEFYTRIIHQTPFSLIVRKEDKETKLPPMGWILVFFERANGVFSFTTMVKKVEQNSILHLAHSEKIIRNQHRRYYRKKIALPVKVKLWRSPEPFKQSTIIDLSGGGVSLANPGGTYKLGDRLTLHFILPSGKKVAVNGKVVRFSQFKHLLHVNFEPMDEFLRDNIIGCILNSRSQFDSWHQIDTE